jgi:hypothetical protein
VKGFIFCTKCKKSPQWCTCKNRSKMSSKKFDSGKADLSILSITAMSEIAKAFEFGSKKYGRYNYLETGFQYTRLLSACMRHIGAWTWGEEYDQESGLSHLAHAGACVVMLLDHVHYKIGEDNRFKRSTKK